jgi:hypothetical protein
MHCQAPTAPRLLLLLLQLREQQQHAPNLLLILALHIPFLLTLHKSCSPPPLLKCRSHLTCLSQQAVYALSPRCYCLHCTHLKPAPSGSQLGDIPLLLVVVVAVLLDTQQMLQQRLLLLLVMHVLQLHAESAAAAGLKKGLKFLPLLLCCCRPQS